MRLNLQVRIRLSLNERKASVHYNQFSFCLVFQSKHHETRSNYIKKVKTIFHKGLGIFFTHTLTKYEPRFKQESP